MGIYETYCTVKYTNWPSSGTTVTNEGSAGSAYNATLSANASSYYVLSHGVKSLDFPSGFYINIPKGTAVNDLSNATVEWSGRWDGTGLVIWGKQNSAGGWSAVTMGSDGQINIFRARATGYDQWYETVKGIYAGQLYHVAVTWTTAGANPIVYINGVSQALSRNSTGSGAFATDVSYDARILVASHTGANTTDGSIVTWRLHNAVLTAAQVLNNAAIDLSHLKIGTRPLICSSHRGSGVYDVFGVEGIGSGGFNIFWKSYDGSAWSGWSRVTSTSGESYSPPVSITPGDGTIWLFVLGSNRLPYYNYYDGSWHSWTLVPNSSAVTASYGSTLSVCSRGSGLIDLFYTRSDNAGILWNTWNGSSWASNFTDLGGGIYAGTDAAASARGTTIDLVVIGTDFKPWHKKYSSGSWGSWAAAGATTCAPVTPVLAYDGTDVYYVVFNTSNVAYYNKYTVASSTWGTMAAVSGTGGGYSHAAVKTASATVLYYLYSQGDAKSWSSLRTTSWTGWTAQEAAHMPIELNGKLTPSLVSAGSGTAQAILHYDEDIRQSTWSGSAWAASTTLNWASRFDITVSMPVSGCTADDSTVTPDVANTATDVDGAIVTNCQVEYIGDSFPTTGIAIDNVGLGVDTYDGIADANYYAVGATGAKCWMLLADSHYLAIPYGGAIDNLPNVTLELGFYKYAESADYQTLFGKADNTGYLGWNIFVGTGGSLIILRGKDASNYRGYYVASSGVTAGHYCHIAMTWDMTTYTTTPTLKVSIDGGALTDLTASLTNISTGTVTSWANDSSYYGTIGTNQVATASAGLILTHFRLHNTILSSGDLTTNFNASKWRLVNRICALTSVNATSDDGIVTPSIISNSTVTMPVVNCSADDSTLTPVLICNPTVVMTVRNCSADDSTLTPVLICNPTVVMTVRNCSADDSTVTTTILQTRTVSMPVSNCSVDDSTLTTTILQTRTVSMPVSNCSVDDSTVTPVCISNPTKVMTCPGATSDDAAISKNITDVDGAIVTNCVVEYIQNSFPSSGAVIDNERGTGATYDGVEDSGINYLGVLPSGAKYWNTSTSDWINIPYGSATDNLSKFTVEVMFYWTAGIATHPWLKQYIELYVGITGAQSATRNTVTSGHYMQYNGTGAALTAGWHLAQLSWDCTNTTTAPIIKIDGSTLPLSANDQRGGDTTWISDAGLSSTINFAPQAGPWALFRLHNTNLSSAELDANYDASKWRMSGALVSMTCPTAMADDATETTLIVQDVSVAMTVPNCSADDATETTLIVQDKSISMPISNCSADEGIVTSVEICNPTIQMSSPSSSAIFGTAIVAISDWGVCSAPNCTTATGIVVTEIIQTITVSMSVPGSATDDSVVTTSILQTRTVSMTVMNCSADDSVVISSLLSNPTVSMSCPSCVADTYGVTSADVSLELTISPDCSSIVGTVTTAISDMDAYVNMSVPGSLSDEGTITTAIIQSKTIAMSVPYSITDDGIVTSVKICNPTILMSTPNNVVNLGTAIVAISDWGVCSAPNCTTATGPVIVDIYTPSKDVPITVVPDCATSTETVTASILQTRTVSMSVPFCASDDSVVTSVLICNPTIVMPVPYVVSDDSLVTTILICNYVVEMSVPSGTADDSIVTPILICNPTIVLSSLACSTEIGTVSSVISDYGVCSAPNCTTATGIVVTEIIQTITVSMSVPLCTADDSVVIPSTLQTRTVSMSVPYCVSDASVVTSVLISNPTVAMPVCNCVSDDSTVTPVLICNCTVSMAVPYCSADESTVTSVLISNPTVAIDVCNCTSDDSAVTPVLICNYTVSMSVPNCSADDSVVTSVIICNPTIVIASPECNAQIENMIPVVSDYSVCSAPNCISEVGVVTTILISNLTLVMSSPTGSTTTETVVTAILQDRTVDMPVVMCNADASLVTPVLIVNPTIVLTSPDCSAITSYISSSVVQNRTSELTALDSNAEAGIPTIVVDCVVSISVAVIDAESVSALITGTGGITSAVADSNAICLDALEVISCAISSTVAGAEAESLSETYSIAYVQQVAELESIVPDALVVGICTITATIAEIESESIESTPYIGAQTMLCTVAEIGSYSIDPILRVDQSLSLIVSTCDADAVDCVQLFEIQILECSEALINAEAVTSQIRFTGAQNIIIAESDAYAFDSTLYADCILSATIADIDTIMTDCVPSLDLQVPSIITADINSEACVSSVIFEEQSIHVTTANIDAECVSSIPRFDLLNIYMHSASLEAETGYHTTFTDVAPLISAAGLTAEYAQSLVKVDTTLSCTSAESEITILDSLPGMGSDILMSAATLEPEVFEPSMELSSAISWISATADAEHLVIYRIVAGMLVHGYAADVNAESINCSIFTGIPIKIYGSIIDHIELLGSEAGVAYLLGFIQQFVELDGVITEYVDLDGEIIDQIVLQGELIR